MSSTPTTQRWYTGRGFYLRPSSSIEKEVHGIDCRGLKLRRDSFHLQHAYFLG